MKKNYPFIICFTAFTIFFHGCNSTKQDIAFYDAGLLSSSTILPGTVHVTINHVADSELENQIYNAVGIKLHALNSALEQKRIDGSELFFNIKIIERSFTESFDSKNSIFIYSSITDSKENVVYENCFYTKSGESILSSTNQNRHINKIFDDITTLIRS